MLTRKKKWRVLFFTYLVELNETPGESSMRFVGNLITLVGCLAHDITQKFAD